MELAFGAWFWAAAPLLAALYANRGQATQPLPWSVGTTDSCRCAAAGCVHVVPGALIGGPALSLACICTVCMLYPCQCQGACVVRRVSLPLCGAIASCFSWGVLQVLS